jgi:hypothetical protein
LGKETKKALEARTSGPASKKNRVQVLEVEPNGGTWEQQSLTRVTVERFGSERQADSMFEKYDERCELRVRRAFRLPPIFVGMAEDYTFASAYASYTVAEAQVFKPEREEFDEMMTMVLLPAMGFAGYGMASKPLTIEDSTLKLQGAEIAIQTNVVNDAELLEELNKATGTNFKADAKLAKLKSNSAMGLNPDGSKPVMPPPPVQGIPPVQMNPSPSVARDEGNPKGPKGLSGPSKIGGPIAKPASTPNASPKPGKGSAAPAKASSVGKAKKSEGSLYDLAKAVTGAMQKGDLPGLAACMHEIRGLDEDDRGELREITFGIIKADQLAGSGCETFLRLIKGKSHGAPVFNGGDGTMIPPGPVNSDEEFSHSNSTKASHAHAATAPVGVDHSPHKPMDRFISAMTPGTVKGK